MNRRSLLTVSRTWHIGQLIMATGGAFFLALITFGAAFAWTEGMRPTTAQEMGYSGANADTIALRGDMLEWARSIASQSPSSTVVSRLEAEGLEARKAKALQYASGEQVAIAVMEHLRVPLDFSGRDALQRRKRVILSVACLLAVIIAGVVPVWWWRWFGARAPSRAA